MMYGAHRSGVYTYFNTLRLRQNGRHFADDNFKCIFFNNNVWISIKISLKFVRKAPINNITTLVQVMAWRRPGDKPLFEPMMVSLLMHICVTRPQWVKPKHATKIMCNVCLLICFKNDDNENKYTLMSCIVYKIQVINISSHHYKHHLECDVWKK